jgi:hypothetical protein
MISDKRIGLAIEIYITKATQFYFKNAKALSLSTVPILWLFAVY